MACRGYERKSRGVALARVNSKNHTQKLCTPILPTFLNFYHSSFSATLKSYCTCEHKLTIDGHSSGRDHTPKVLPNWLHYVDLNMNIHTTDIPTWT